MAAMYRAADRNDSGGVLRRAQAFRRRGKLVLMAVRDDAPARWLAGVHMSRSASVWLFSEGRAGQLTHH